MIYLAYDGSINGDWISRYAMRMAARAGAALHLLHVEDAEVAERDLGPRIARIEAECERAGVGFRRRSLPLAGDVFLSLVNALPSGAETLVVCGARLRPGGRGYLAGTVSERLLGWRRAQVLALRVVQPGLLGAPRRFLIAVSDHTDRLRAGFPALALLAGQAQDVRLVRVVRPGGILPAWRAPQRRAARVEAARRELQSLRGELIGQLGCDEDSVDTKLRVSGDWAREVDVLARRYRSQLVFLGAPGRTLGGGLFYREPVERVLQDAPCDVAVCRGAR